MGFHLKSKGRKHLAVMRTVRIIVMRVLKNDTAARHFMGCSNAGDDPWSTDSTILN